MEGWYFSRRQKEGALILLIGLSLGIGSWWTWSQQQSSTPLSFPVADSLYVPPSFASADTLRLDINLADSSAWTQLHGIGPVLSRRIVRYRARSGGFDSVGQLKKVYGLPPETYASIRPQLFVNPLTRKQVSVAPLPNRPQPIDINTADAAAWAGLPGIGPVLSQRIVRYRQTLGGFRSVDDLAKVYNLPPETLEQIRPYLTRSAPPSPKSSIAPQPSERFDLNEVSSDQLSEIPGLNGSLAKRILRYRQLLGYYIAVDQLQQVYGLSANTYAKIAPYFFIGDLSKQVKKPLNQASARELAFLPTIEPFQAENLIAARERMGFFRDWDAVAETPGLNQQSLAELQAYYQL